MNKILSCEFNIDTARMDPREMNKIIYPVCTLCRNHERAGFVEEIKGGIR